MKCQYHPENDGIGICVVCGRSICNDDVNLVDNRYICNPCYNDRKKPLMNKKKPWLAILFNLIPGGGYLYLGQIQKALIIFLIWVTLISTNALEALVFALYLYAFIDSHRQARLINANFYEETPSESISMSLYFGLALIIIGSILFMRQFIHLVFLSNLWPLVLIVLGIWIIFRTIRDEPATNEQPEKTAE